MKKCEVLSPVGNMETLDYAISYGADAVYLSGTNYGARKYASNFTSEELETAVKRAHLYGVKVYLTINTLIYEHEIEDLIKYLEFIYQIGVDAIIVQDIGVLTLAHELLPDLELHASTQMHNNSNDMLTLLESLGVKRVVLDREMSLNEIKELPKTIEKEVFCHGALCVSYSGMCLFSKEILNRSGNRGECAGMCRLPYKMNTGGQTQPQAYYLSLKDLSTVNHINEIIDAGVNSLKIEGRMKSKEYVGYMTKIYRKLVDAYYKGEKYSLTEEEYKNIKILFNRGFTEGFIMNTKSEDMVNTLSPNHIGIHLGKYKAINNKIELTLDEDLTQGDKIQFYEAKEGMTVNFLYDKNDKLENHSCKHTVCYVDNFLKIKGTGELRKVGDINLEKEINNLPKRTVKIDGVITIKRDLPITLKVTCDDIVIIEEGLVPEIAQKRELTKEEVLKQIKKTGSYVYEFNNLEVDLDTGLFVNIKDLNELRRTCLDKLNEERTKKRKLDTDIKALPKYKQPFGQVRNIELNVIVETEKQYKVAKKYGVNIFTTNTYLLDKYKDEVYIKYEEKSYKQDNKPCIITDYGSLMHISNNTLVHTNYTHNVLNSYTTNFLTEKGIHTLCLSLEATLKDIEGITKNTSPSYLEVFIYGKTELMKMKYNPAPTSKEVELIDRNNEVYKIKNTPNYRYLISSKPLNKIEELEKYIELGITNFRVDFYDENSRVCETVLSKIVEKIHKNFKSE